MLLDNNVAQNKQAEMEPMDNEAATTAAPRTRFVHIGRHVAVREKEVARRAKRNAAIRGAGQQLMLGLEETPFLLS